MRIEYRDSKTMLKHVLMMMMTALEAHMTSAYQDAEMTAQPLWEVMIGFAPRL